MNLEIREATVDDIDAVLTLWRRAAGPSTLVDEAVDINRVVKTTTSSLLVAVDGDVLVGSIIAGWDGWRGNLYRLAVAKDRRTQGLGRRLVAAAEESLAERGCQRVTALVHLELSDAAPFWAKVGYEHDTEVGRFVRNLE